ncbi:hypothetical protein CLOM_g16652 [Closterium sp. NIES-68]|nr:hypothetical protein CLOM_g16652 [Closterium sp. NIES-68]GJP67313.1 hypothetical protein CLOP_g24144 [Closterium sp. NIES-67]
MVDKAPSPSPPETTHKSESAVASLLASGYMLSKDALEKARALDERHGISQTASTSMAAVKEKTTATAAALDKKFNISEKISGASASVSSTFSSVDETYHVTSKAKAAAAAAEATLSHAGQQVMNNPYVASGRDWMMGIFERLKQQTLEQVKKAEG